MLPSSMPGRWQAGCDSLPGINCCGDTSGSYLILPHVSPCSKYRAQLLGTKGEEMVLAHLLKPLVGQKSPCYSGDQHRKDP